MKLLICNAGSTSLKFKLWEMPQETALAEGKVERIGLGDAIFTYRNPALSFEEKLEHRNIMTYTEGISMFLSHLTDPRCGAVPSMDAVEAVGFKTVLSKDHYGVHRIDSAVKAGMRAYFTVAPAHNGPYLEAIEVFEKLLPGKPLVGVFETAFHRSIPEYRRQFALPAEWTEKYGLRRMGYHGASHGYIAEKTGKTGRVISCHLGGSSSICAIRDGVSIDNSFALSLQAGMPHNNRVGDLDAYVVLYLLKEGLSWEEIEHGLNGEGGLKGVSGTTGDMRDLTRAMDEGSDRARLAFDMYVDSIVRYIGSYHVFLGGLDTLVFTGGIGENSARLRQAVCARLACLGVRIDPEKNEGGEPERVISAEDSPVTVRVIPAGEEWMVARAAYRHLTESRPGGR